MLLELAVVYLTVALFVAVRTTGRLHRLPARRGERLDGAERAILWGVGLFASALWLVFFPVFGRGWVRTRVPAMVTTARGRVRAARRSVADRFGRRRARGVPAEQAPAEAPPEWLLSVSGGTRPAALLPAPPSPADSPEHGHAAG